MTRYRREVEGDDGWSRWVQPVMRGYRLACCDCGLVHDMEFKALRRTGVVAGGTWLARPLDDDRYRIEFRARRNNRSTAGMRRKRKSPCP